MDADTSQGLDEIHDHLHRLDEGIATLRSEIRDGLAGNRRHFDVITESLRDDIRIIAEGVVSLGAKVDRTSGSGPRS